MAGLAPLLLLRLSLSTCCVLLLLLLAACPSLAFAPCQQSASTHAFDTFKKRHMPQRTPNTLDQNAWFKFIKDNTPGCDRPMQSFLVPPATVKLVKAVCSSQGGKVYNEDLCISQKQFTFVTVRSEQGTCNITSVKKETKHLIVACKKVDNKCLPVHFEANPYNVKPYQNARACQAPATNDAKNM